MNTDRFWSKVQIGSKDACWNWMGGKHRKGYGHYSEKQNGKQINYYAHRLAFSLWPGNEFPIGLVVMHKCDNPSCCNPFHLSAGTQLENMADMRIKGRSAKGQKHWTAKNPGAITKGSSIGTSKLTDEKVKEIRRIYETGSYSLSQVAKEYGVAFQTVSKIINRKSWRHV